MRRTPTVTPTPTTEAVDSVARDKITGLRSEFHEFRDEVRIGLSGMDRKIGDGLSQIFNRLDSDAKANLQASKSGIGIIASFALGVIGLAFSFTTLITQPLRDQDSRHTSQLDRLDDHHTQRLQSDSEIHSQLGELSVIAERNTETNTKLSELQRENALLNYEQGNSISYLRGQVEALRTQLNAVDAGGLRRGNTP